MLNRWVEDGLLDVLEAGGAGCIAFSPLAQGLLSNRYLSGIPTDSRAANATSPFLKNQDITADKLMMIEQLNKVASERGQTLAQLALSWVLRQQQVTSVLIGASKMSQIEENVAAVNRLDFDAAELERIDNILAGQVD